jgi:predicted O-methyltransferase YrrM
MSDAPWMEVDGYITELLVRPDSALNAAMEASVAADLPAIAVTPPQGKLLQILARGQGARNVLEIGTLGGYSTIWLARGLAPGGRITTLEINPRHAEIATANVARAGFADVVQLRLGPALETLARIAEEGGGPFDLIFIDADKASTPEYFDRAVKLSRPGTLILVDNVVRNGGLADGASDDASIRGVRRLHEQVSADSRVSATTVQTVGSKGYDGFLIAVVERV